MPKLGPTQKFDVLMPSGINMAHFYREGVALSPDGTRLTFVAKAGLGTSAKEQKKSQLFIRGIDQWDAVPLPGTKGAIQPFFSPDNQWLRFVSHLAQKTVIMKMPLSGGSPIPVTESNRV